MKLPDYLSCLQFSFLLLLLGQVLAMPTTATFKPKLIDNREDDPQPITYSFIVDHRPTSLGQNYYIKPGQLVGMFTVDSDMLEVRHEDSKRNISSKLNILFVAAVKEKENSTKSSS